LSFYPKSGEGATRAWDVRDRSLVNLEQGLRELKYVSSNVRFAFVAPGRLLLTNSYFLFGKNGVVTGKLVEFPSGKLLAKPKVPPGPYPIDM
jgi:hypothetical protein